VLRTMAHLSRDETAPKMGHPVVVRQMWALAPDCGVV
jgi:hypothetical protein